MAVSAAVRINGELTEYRPWTRQPFLDATLPQRLLFSPGENWAYSNIGYMLIVDIPERVAGRSFRQGVAEQVVEPLELQRTSPWKRSQRDDLALQLAEGGGHRS